MALRDEVIASHRNLGDRLDRSQYADLAWKTPPRTLRYYRVTQRSFRMLAFWFGLSGSRLARYIGLRSWIRYRHNDALPQMFGVVGLLKAGIYWMTATLLHEGYIAYPLAQLIGVQSRKFRQNETDVAKMVRTYRRDNKKDFRRYVKSISKGGRSRHSTCSAPVDGANPDTAS